VNTVIKNIGFVHRVKPNPIDIAEKEVNCLKYFDNSDTDVVK